MGRSVSVYKDKLLVVKGSPEDIRRVQQLPKHWRLPSGDQIAIPWTYEDSAWLTVMGFPSVSPIFRDYNWSGPWVPMRHQRRIADFLIRNKRAYCLAGTGTGKTGACVWAADYLLQMKQIRRVLVICPLSVLLDAWVPTVNKLLFTRHAIAAIRGEPAKKRRLLAGDATFHVINFDAVESVHDELVANKYDLVIIDESTAIKNKNTRRWPLIKQLVDVASYAWQLTGTPTPQGPIDAYGQLAMFDRFERVSGEHCSVRYWENMVTIQINTFKRVPKIGWQDTVAKYMWPAQRIRTRDCIDLPPRTDTRRYAPLTKYQEASIKLLIKEQMMIMDGQQISAVNRGVLMTKLAQICAGAVYSSDGSVVEVKPSKRLAEVSYIFGQAEGKVIVFVPFRSAVQLVARHLRKEGWKVATVDGSVSATARQKIFDQFQTPGRETMDGIIAVPGCMSHGVTLTEADNVVWYAPAPSNEIYEQAIARMERNGQQRHMTVTELWGHQREKELYDIIAGRSKGQLTLLDICNNLLRGTE